MMTHAQMESMLLQQDHLIRKLQEQIAALMPRTGGRQTLDGPLVDQEHSGNMSDAFEHGTKGTDGHVTHRLCHRAQRAYYIDPSGRVGKDWTHIVQASNEEWLAVSGWVP